MKKYWILLRKKIVAFLIIGLLCNVCVPQVLAEEPVVNQNQEEANGETAKDCDASSGNPNTAPVEESDAADDTVSENKTISGNNTISENDLTNEIALLSLFYDELPKTEWDISSGDVLIAFAKAVNQYGDCIDDWNVTLKADIDLSNSDWNTCIGKVNDFIGTFEGNNHVITLPANSYGLFGCVLDSTIQNVIIKQAGGSVKWPNCCGAGCIGALVAHADGSTFKNCRNLADVKWVEKKAHYKGVYVGGLVGYADNCSFQNCWNAGNVEITNYAENVESLNYAGGIAGVAFRSGEPVITSCFNSGDITGVVAGGLVGRISGYGISNAFNTGNVTGNTADGIVGSNGGVTTSISNVYSTNKMTNDDTVKNANGNSVFGENSNWSYQKGSYPRLTGMRATDTDINKNINTNIDQAAMIVSTAAAYLDQDENVDSTLLRVSKADDLTWNISQGDESPNLTYGTKVSGTVVLTASKGGFSKKITIQIPEGKSAQIVSYQNTAIGCTFSGTQCSIEDGTVSVSYNASPGILVQPFLVNKEITDYNFTVTVTGQPEGLSFNADTGKLEGTVTNSVGTGTMQLKILDKAFGEYHVVSTNWKVYPAQLEQTDFQIADLAVEEDYRGNAITKTVTTSLASDNYDVSYSNNQKPGKATLTINGKGNYTGSLTYEFQIKQAQVAGGQVRLKPSVPYTLSESGTKWVLSSQPEITYYGGITYYIEEERDYTFKSK